MRIRSFLGPLYWAILCCIVVSFPTHASTLSFSARLVNSDGSPVAGPVELLFELAYSNNTTNILCTKELNSVALSSGVFHANLEFGTDECGDEFFEVLEATPTGESLMMRVVDETDGADVKTYPFQALNTVPMSVMSEVSKTLSQMGATSGQVLRWNGTEWAPENDDGEPGTITSITAGDGLDGGTITETGTVSVKSGGIVVGMLAPDSVTSAKIDDKTIQNADIADGQIKYIKLNLGAGDIPNDRVAGLGSAALADIGMSNDMVLGAGDVPSCAADEKLRKVLMPSTAWVCEADTTGTDDTKLPLAGGAMTGAIDMGTNAVTNLPVPNLATDATTKQYVDTELSNKANTTDLDSYVARAGDNMTGALKLDAQNELRLADGDSNEYIGLRSHANVVGNYVLTFPADIGASDQVLSTDGSGNLSWTTPSTTATPEGSAGGELAGTYPNPTIDDNVIDNANIATGANVDATKLGTGAVDNTEFNTLNGVTSSIQTQLDGKEGNLPAGGTTGNFLRGDKSWQALTTDDVSEATNKYFLDSRAQTAVVRQTITTGQTNTSPSEDAVNTALAGKADNADLDSYVLRAGDSMSGSLDMGATNTVTNLAAPSVASDAATKQYVDDGLATKAESTDLNDYVAIAGDTMTGPLKIGAQNELRLADTGSTNYVGLRSSATVTSYTLTLPAATGASDQVLATDGAGNLSWSTPSTTATPEGAAGGELAGTYPNPTIADGMIDNANIATAAGIDAAKLGTGVIDNTEFNTLDGVTSSIQTQLDAKEGTITAGVAGDYWRGDKTWQTLNTDAVAEATNQYFTGARARTAVVDDAIVDATTDRAPSQNAVFDALADKANSTDLDNYVLKAGDTMTGALNVPADGLSVGTNQLITTGGYVGIGTATPQRKLHLSHAGANDLLLENATDSSSIHLRTDTSGDAYINNMNNFVTNGTAGNALLTLTGQDGIRLNYGNSGSSGTETMRIDNTGNVGIGTTSPGTDYSSAKTLHLKSTGRSSLVIEGSDASYATLVLSSGTQNSTDEWHLNSFGSAGEKALNFWNGGNKMTLLQNGNVGIGTNTPTSKLEVNGDIKITGRVIQSTSPASSLPVSLTGLAGYWNFQEGAGDDHSGNGNTGDLRDADAANADGDTPPYILESRSSSALWCDGVDDYFHIESSASLNITSSAFTFEGWIFWNGEEQDNAFLNKESQYEVRISPTGQLSAAISTEDNNPGWAWVDSTWSVPIGRWVHVGITYDGTNIGYWGDGRKVDTQANTTTGAMGTGSEALRLCARSGNSAATGFQSLSLDEVRIWNRILSPAEFYRLAAGTPVGR